MKEMKIEWVHGTLWATKEACDQHCQVIHPRLGIKEASTAVVRRDAVDQVLAEAVWAMELIQKRLRHDYKKVWEDHPFPISDAAIDAATIADTNYQRAQAFLTSPTIAAFRARQAKEEKR